MYNPLAVNILDSEVTNFFQDHGIILAFVKDEEKLLPLRAALASLESNTPLKDAVIAQIFAIGISFQRPILLELAESLDFWISPLMKNNPVWVEYIYERSINGSSTSDEVFSCLVRAAQACDNEEIANLIHLGLVDKDSFEDADKKIDRFNVAIKTYLRLCEQKGVSRHHALDLTCEAICNTNVINNQKYAEPLIKILDNLLRDYVPSFEFVSTIASQGGIDKSNIPFYKKSYLAVLNKIVSAPNADQKRMLMKHLPFFPDETFAFIKSLPLRVQTSPAFINVVEMVFHSDWLNSAMHLEDSFKDWAKMMITDDYFSSTRLMNNDMRSCSGECSSLMVSQIMHANGASVLIPEIREAHIARLILENHVAARITDLSIYADALKENSVARLMIRTYAKITAANQESDNCVKLSNDQKIEYMACNLLAEMYYMQDKNKPLGEQTPFHQAMKIQVGSGNKLYSHNDYMRIILSQMAPEKMLENIEKPAIRRSFLIYMLKNKDIPMSYAAKLKPVDRRALLEDDFTI